MGSVVLPRVGQEVVVSFLDNAPDRPIVTGCLFHGLHKTPYPLPEHKSRSVLRSQSLSGTDGHELMLEDRAGQETVAVHSARNFELHVTQDARVSIDRQAQSHIAGDQLMAIQGTQHLTVQGERRTRINGQGSLNLGQSLNPAGVFLNGPLINLNSGGGGGSAAAASPKAPEPPRRVADKKAGKATSKALEAARPADDPLRFEQLQKAPVKGNFEDTQYLMVSAGSMPVPGVPPWLQAVGALNGYSLIDSQEARMEIYERLKGVAVPVDESWNASTTLTRISKDPSYTHTSEIATRYDRVQDLIKRRDVAVREGASETHIQFLEKTLEREARELAALESTLAPALPNVLENPGSGGEEIALTQAPTGRPKSPTLPISTGGNQIPLIDLGGYETPAIANGPWVTEYPEAAGDADHHLVFSEIEDIKRLRAENPKARLEQLAWDPDTKKYRVNEAQTAFDIEEEYGYFGRYKRPSNTAPKGDYQSLSGQHKGQTFDDFGSEINEGMIQQLKIKPARTKRKFFESLEDHLTKSDNVVLNLTTLKKEHNELYLETLEYIKDHPLKYKVIDVTK